MSIQVKYVIQDVHMGLGHEGLSDFVRSYRKKRLISESGLILFINKARTKCKIYQEDGQVLGYLSLKVGTLTPKSLDLIPATFGGSLEYSRSAKKALEEFFKSEQYNHVGLKLSKNTQRFAEAS